MTVQMDQSWLDVLADEFKKPYIDELRNFLRLEQQSSLVFPPNNLIFNAYNTTPFDQTKVVIIGQDPYHNPGQAHGLSFSVPKSTKIPPSLRNIYKELTDDLGITPPAHGDLTEWAQRGVLLLNTVLTVRAHSPTSHQNQGWEQLTTRSIQELNQRRQNVVFVLWGSRARSKQKLIDQRKHLIITSAHPSPLSAYRGFFGSKPFSKCNNYLNRNGKPEIDWSLSS